ncbi:MAG: RtcB family protein [Spirochaetaceae bacterium]|jgi:RNA-splicing ligase RtcB|nr:RtcB family protein [Spirochaetaceae bacterium]
MIEITGKYNGAKVFSDSLDDKTISQVEALCDQKFSEGSVIRLMPDAHAGAGCSIGTTMTLRDTVVPNLVGVDIGCGMETAVIRADSGAALGFDGAALDRLIRANIPSGMAVRREEHEAARDIDLESVRCPAINKARAKRSVGTLGGGNHFIEAGRDGEGNLYIVIHSGSRHLGLEIAEYYQKEAWKQLNGSGESDMRRMIAEYKEAGRDAEIEEAVKALKERVVTDVPRELAYVSGDLFSDYISDMKIAQRFAFINRKAMQSVILEGLGVVEEDVAERFTTVHNYIDTENMILRKGAVSARAGEKLLIPMNMRDGSLVCEGLGNADWNYSAPHGAGRLMSRTKAFAELRMDDYKAAMAGIYSTSVNRHTIDESPMAYKSMDNIIANMTPTVKITARVKPVYNFKAAEAPRKWKRR